MTSVTAVVLSTLALTAQAWPQPNRARVLERQIDVAEEYDYVIIGGGTAGLTVGDRLTEDGESMSLLLLHAKGLSLTSSSYCSCH